MSIFQKVVLFSFLGLLTTTISFAVKDKHVLVLTDLNFDEEVSRYEYILVDFYAPWCGHCKRLEPEYSEAGKILNELNIPIAKVDCTVQKELTERFKINAFPTILLFVKGEPYPYTGGRASEEIVNWMKHKTLPATNEFKSIEEIEESRKNNNILFIFFGDDKSIFHDFELIASVFDNYKFGYTADEQIRAKFEAEKNSVVLFKDFDEFRNDLRGVVDADTLKAFAEVETVRKLFDFDDKIAGDIFSSGKPGLILYRDQNSEESALFDNVILRVAKKVKSKDLIAVRTDIKEGTAARMAKYLGLNTNELPTIRLIENKKELKHYRLEGEINEDNLLKFVKEWQSGTLNQYYKSQEIPLTQGDVTVIVGKSFDKIVLDETKNVLTFFYAPWCKKCLDFIPDYEKLAVSLKENEEIVISKIDLSLNEIPKLIVKGYPMFKLYVKGKKDAPLDYEGEVNIEGLSKFINDSITSKSSENSKIEL